MVEAGMFKISNAEEHFEYINKLLLFNNSFFSFFFFLSQIMYLSLKIESNKLSLFLLKLSELFVIIYWLQLKRSYQYPFIQYLGISNNPFYNFFYLIISCEKMIPKNKGINCSVRNNISYNNRGRGI